MRELRNALERMVVLARGEKLTVRDLPAAIREAAGKPAAPGAGRSLAEAEKMMIQQALRLNAGHRTKAAQQLGISRRTLHRKLNEFQLRAPAPAPEQSSASSELSATT